MNQKVLDEIKFRFESSLLPGLVVVIHDQLEPIRQQIAAEKARIGELLERARAAEKSLDTAARAYLNNLPPIALAAMRDTNYAGDSLNNERLHPSPTRSRRGFNAGLPVQDFRTAMGETIKALAAEFGPEEETKS